MTIHNIKCEPKYYQQIKSRSKKFELRKNDRDYKVGDFLILKEWDDGYSGDDTVCKVTSILYDYQFIGLQQGYCIMSIKLVK